MPLSLPARAFHSSAKLGARLFGGHHGTIPSGGPEPGERTAAGLAALSWPGDAERLPVVLLHGMNANAVIWARVGRLLAEDRPVWALDMPGHGRSQAPADWRLQTTCDAVLAALDGLGVERFHLAAHSWGGKVATLLAADDIGRVGTLTLADPAPPGRLGALFANPKLFGLAFEPERTVYPDRDAMMQGAGHCIHYGYGDDGLDVRQVERSYRQGSDGAWRHVLPDDAFAAIVSDALTVDLRDRLAQIDVPVLLMQPDYSVGRWPGSFSPLRALPGVYRQVVRGDHAFIYTNPVDTAAAMKGVLDGSD